MNYVLAAFPILLILFLMVKIRIGGHIAGPIGLLACIFVAIIYFGLNADVFWVSQVKGLMISAYTLIILWPALFLYNIVNNLGGISAASTWFEYAIGDRGLVMIVLAWCFSAVLEGLSGFGLPVAVVSPLIVSLGIDPIIAVAATAIGHTWSITFGDMGIIYQVLLSITGIPADKLSPVAALMLGIACLACGLAVANILGQRKRWPSVLIIGIVMASVQYILVVIGLSALGGFGAGISGMVAAVILGRKRIQSDQKKIEIQKLLSNENDEDEINISNLPEKPTLDKPALKSAVFSYGGLALLMTALALPSPINQLLNKFSWTIYFPSVITNNGYLTTAGPGQIYKPFLHPGVSLALVCLISYIYFRRANYSNPKSWRIALKSTYRSSITATIGVVATIGLSTLMEHCGMTMLLAHGISDLVGGAYPLVSPIIGILGAFATGSNLNSNVLFANLQKTAAQLLNIDPRVLISAQTAGGAVGGMISPAKIMVGSSTVNLRGKDGWVLRKTIGYGLAIGVILGIFTLILASIYGITQ